MITEWVLIVSLYQGGMQQVHIASRESCSAAVVAVHNSNENFTTFCVNTKTGQLLEVK